MEISVLPTSWVGLLGNYAGVVLVSGGAAYAVFRLFGEKWLTAKFDERLAAYKYAQKQELAQLNGKISALLDRTVKLHQREFDVLPEVWGRLNDAYTAVRPIGLALIMYPDVNRMTEAQLNNLLDKSQFADWQKDELRTASDKTRYFADTLTHMNLVNAHAKFLEFDAYLTKSGIFIPEPIKSQFSRLNTLMYETVMERRLQRSDEPQKFDKGVELHEKGPRMLKELERDVQSRLWNSQIDPSTL